MIRQIAGIMILAAQLGCNASPEAASESTNAGQASRSSSASRAMVVTLDSLWRITAADTGALVEPAFVAAGFGRVFVTDAVTGLVALGPDGRLLWTAAGQGYPGQQSLGALTVRSDSTIAIVERSGTRLWTARVDNGTMRETILARRWSPNTVCTPTDSTVLLTMSDAPLGLVHRNGREVDLPAYPWIGMRDSAVILQQTIAASSSTADGCLIAQAFGGGFALTDDGIRYRVFETPEVVSFPRVLESVDSTADAITRSTRLAETVPAAIQAALTDRHVMIAFGGSTPRREGLVDLYDRGSATYLGSAKIGAPVRALAASGDTLLVLHGFEGRTALTAWRFRLSRGVAEPSTPSSPRQALRR